MTTTPIGDFAAALAAATAARAAARAAHHNSRAVIGGRVDRRLEAAYRAAWAQEIQAQARLDAALAGHAVSVEPSPKMDAPALVRGACSCGWRGTSTSETFAARSALQHAVDSVRNAARPAKETP